MIAKKNSDPVPGRAKMHRSRSSRPFLVHTRTIHPLAQAQPRHDSNVNPILSQCSKLHRILKGNSALIAGTMEWQWDGPG
jgi:hypothetical protein